MKNIWFFLGVIFLCMAVVMVFLDIMKIDIYYRNTLIYSTLLFSVSMNLMAFYRLEKLEEKQC